MGKKKKVFLAALIFMAFVFSMLVGAAWAKRRAKSAPAERIEVVRITVRTTGFEPKEIQYPNRPFLLAVDNQSGLEKLTLEMYREVGNDRNKIQELKLSLRSLRKREITNLNPGSYVLKEANHADWICRITITPK